MSLSPVEREVMDLLAREPGLTNKELATRLGIGLRGVNKRLTGAFAVYGASNRTEAVMAHVSATRRRSRSRRPVESLSMDLA
jgi:DNA-binding CsgD family transcriptional regulator